MFEFLGGFFDFDGSGTIEADEAAIGLAMLEDMMNDNNYSSQTSPYEYSYSFEDDESESDDWSDFTTDLYIAGLDEDDLRWMDEDERYSALEEAGLDPYDFEYLDY